MKFDVITVGAAVRDVYVQSNDFTIEDNDTDGVREACFVLGGKLETDAPVFSSGGGATNAAATFAHLGFKVGCVAKIGGDAPGKDIRADLKHHGVHTSLLVTSEKEPTGYSTLLTTNEGRRTALVYRGASATLKAKDIDWSNLTAKWFYITSLKGNTALLKKLFKHAHATDTSIAWNPGSTELALGRRKLEPSFKRTDVLTLNREEAAALLRLAPSDLSTILSRMAELVGRYVVITDGKRGTYATNGTDTYFAPPNDVPVVNATGAGDAFGSGFTAGMMQFEDIAMALRLGTLNAESVIQQVGAKNGLLPRMPGSRALGQVRVEPYRTS